MLPGATIVNDVVYTQVCVAFEDDATTTAVYDAILAEGEIYPSPSRWRDRAVIRISVSNWQTHEAEVATTVAAFERARALGQLTGPVHFSPGPLPISSGNGDASRNASCTERSPSRRARAW